jgi:hypothetical protein
MTADLKRTWLVQRLCKPYNSPGILGLDSPFAFGGGLRNCGLSGEVMDLLRPIFRFDYMGAAEFEFGAVPKALGRLAENHKHLTPFSIAIALADVEAGWREKETPAAGAKAEVFILCQRSHAEQVEERVRELARKDYSLKEATRLPSTLRPSSQYDGETVGWLELDNGFLFFTDRDMWAATSALFGVKVEAVSA